MGPHAVATPIRIRVVFVGCQGVLGIAGDYTDREFHHSFRVNLH